MRVAHHACVLPFVATVTFCGGGGSTGPDSTPTAVLAPAVNSFSLTSYSPPAGSTLGMGSMISVTGTYTVTNPELWCGLGAVREDGKTYLFGMASTPSPSNPPYNFRVDRIFDPRNAAYDFFRGHTVDLVFVIGHFGMWGSREDEGRGEGIIWSQVAFRYSIATQYKTE